MNLNSSFPNRPSRLLFRAAVTAATALTIFSHPLFGDENQKDRSKDQTTVPPPAEVALQRLLEGNQRFATGKARHPHAAMDWRLSLEAAQHPFAVVLGCADSRVPPELLFDQGLGDLFVIRVAGNIVDTDVTASIEYAVDHLHTHLVVVLGHSNCGAVTATLDHLTDSPREPDEIVSLLYRIEPALENLPKDLPRQKKLDLAIKRNVQFVVKRLTEVPDLRKNLRAGKLQIVGAVYNMHTGRVDILKP